MFDRMFFLGNVFTVEELQALLVFLNDNPNVVVALRKKKVVMLVNAEKILVRKQDSVMKLVDSLDLKNYLVKQSETDIFVTYRFRPAEVKELHDLAIAVYAISNLMNEPGKEPEPPVQPQVEEKKKEKTKEQQTKNQIKQEKPSTKGQANKKEERKRKIDEQSRQTKNDKSRKKVKVA